MKREGERGSETEGERGREGEEERGRETEGEREGGRRRRQVGSHGLSSMAKDIKDKKNPGLNLQIEHKN